MSESQLYISGPAYQVLPRQHRNDVPCAAGCAPWAQSYLNKKLPRAAELTLEKVFDEWQHPPMTVIDSLWDLHQIPRRRAVQWFAKRRMAEEQDL